MKQIHFSRKTRQLSRLVKELKNALKSNVYLSSNIGHLKIKISLLLKNLQVGVSRHQLRNILGSFAVVFGLAFSTKSHAQLFTAPLMNPFGIGTSSSFMIGGVETRDLDGDGDLDMIQGGANGDLMYFENTGSASVPVFASPLINPFGLSSAYDFAFPTAADIDGDGDIDLLIGEYDGDLKYFENIGTVNAPDFAAPVTNPFGLNVSSYSAAPEFVDLDGDGDFDLLVGTYYGNLYYYVNTGTINTPAFAPVVPNPFGLDFGTISTYYMATPSFADLDADGDLDLLVGMYEYGNMDYFENTGNVNSPAFAAAIQNPFGLIETNHQSFLNFSDLDTDGDFDLLVAEYYGNIQYFENVCTAGYGIDVITACVSYTWIDGITYVTNNNSATFNILGGSSGGCDSIVTLDLTINTVDIGVSATYPNIIANATGATFQWLNCSNSYAAISGQTGMVFTVANGSYAVQVSQNGCVDTSACINVSNVDIEQGHLLNSLVIYPNPTNGIVNINFGNLNNSNLKVYSIDGRVVYQKNDITTSIYQFELNEVAGIYFVEIISEGEKKVFKLVKK